MKRKENNMKERIEKIAIAILLLIGLSVVFAIIKYYLPEWVYYTCLVALTAYVLYLVSKPESKKSYWYFTYVMKDEAKIAIGYGLQEKETEEFGFYNFYKEYPESDIIMVERISERQYNMLSELIKSRKEDE